MFVWITFTRLQVTAKAGFYSRQPASWTNILFYNEKSSNVIYEEEYSML